MKTKTIIISWLYISYKLPHVFFLKKRLKYQIFCNKNKAPGLKLRETHIWTFLYHLKKSLDMGVNYFRGGCGCVFLFFRLQVEKALSLHYRLVDNLPWTSGSMKSNGHETAVENNWVLWVKVAAARTYDASHEASFKTYATTYIKNAMLAEIMNNNNYEH